MELQRYADVETFLAAAGDFLVAREAEHNLLLGVCQSVRDTPDAYTAPPYFATVSDGGRILAVALQTPPFQLVISEVDDPEVRWWCRERSVDRVADEDASRARQRRHPRRLVDPDATEGPRRLVHLADV